MSPEPEEVVVKPGMLSQGVKQHVDAVNEQALAKTARPQVAMDKRGVMLQTMDELARFSSAVMAAGMAPKGIKNKESAMLAIQAGMELGLTPMRALGCMTVINGHAAPMGDTIKAIVLDRRALKPGTSICTGIELGPKGLDDDATYGWAKAHRIDYPLPREERFTVAQAKRAKLWKGQGPWTTYPERMLQYRAWGFLARDLFADVLHGFVIAEELRDMPPPVQADGAATTDEPPKEDDPLMITDAVVEETS